MATFNDLIYYPSGNRRQGNAVCHLGVSAAGVPASGIVLRGDVVSYDNWANTFSGKFRTQIFVISGSGMQ